MARADNIQSSVLLLSDNVPVENVSGWLVWQLVIITGFIVLFLLTALFFLSRTALWKQIRKKRKPARRRPKKKLSRKTGRRPGSTAKKRKPLPAVKRSKKAYSGKAKRKKSGASRPMKMPFLPDPRIIKSYTGKYLMGEKIKANWERISMVGVDSEEKQLDLSAYLLNSRFQWSEAESDAILYKGQTIKPSKYLKNKSLKEALQNADKLVSVGLITELCDGDKPPELARARAEKMVTWLKKVMPRIKVDYLLILNDPRHIWGSIDEEDRKAEEKRAVLWICLNKNTDDADVDEAVRDALSQAINLPFDFDIYHDVVFEKIAAS